MPHKLRNYYLSLPVFERDIICPGCGNHLHIRRTRIENTIRAKLEDLFMRNPHNTYRLQYLVGMFSMKCSQPKISSALRILYEDGIIIKPKEGHYQYAPPSD